jgi:hypothetical protein
LAPMNTAASRPRRTQSDHFGIDGRRGVAPGRC